MKGPAQLFNRHSFLIPSGIAILCYINILPNDFCFDDVPIVRDNPKIQIDEHEQWSAIWTTDYWSNSGQDAASRDLLYRPVTLSVLRVTRTVGGNRPLAFHIVSLVLHALCTLLVALLVRRLVSEGSQSPGILLWSNAAAWVAAAIFAVLPIHSEAVASVVGQADLLATAGVIGTVLCHIRVTRAATWPLAALWMAASAGCAFVAMGAKESGICVVPLMFLAELLGVTTSRALTLSPAPLPERESGLPSDPSLFKRSVRVSYLLIPLALYLLLRYHAMCAFYQGPAPTKTVNVLVDAPAWQRALGVLQAWGMYWSKTVFPRELAIEYAIYAVRLPTSLLQAHVLTGLLWIVALLSIAVSSWRNGGRATTFLVLALFISYLPTSNLFVLIQVFFAERIWYLPSVFIAGLFAIFGVRLLERRIWMRVGVVCLCAMVVRCWVRNSEWRNNGTLFAATYLDHPQSVMARHLYGQWLTQNGEAERGIALLQKALEIDLGFTDAHRSLGRAFFKIHRVEEAFRELQIADMQVPGHEQTQALLAEASKALETQTGPTLAELEHRATEHPDDSQIQLELVRFLRSIAKAQEALSLLEKSAPTFGRDADWCAEWAVTLVYLDRRDDAIAMYNRAIELDPRNAQTMTELAMLLLERRSHGDLDWAALLMEHAIRLSPKNATMYAAQAEVWALQGDLVGARSSLRHAIQLAPEGSEYQRILMEREKALGQ